jgi:mannose/cellobiose epimerase-like protein (N-acyl-D-glucosamine 2-epimerase family)
LAQAYDLLKKPEYKTRAKDLLRYLNSERKAPHGGYTEIKAGQIVFQSNPHMHLFEAALAWLKIDTDADWKKLSQDLFDLCRSQFVANEAKVICEYFDEAWQPLRENGRFIFEPGHQFEWAWLMLQYESISGTKVGSLGYDLYERGEKYGVKPTGETVDEVWSDFTIKKATSRFWPQSERVKAALDVGSSHGADQALNVLMKYLKTPIKGVWYDTLSESGQFNDQAPKASSLYHIINAMSEYSHKRLSLKN